MLHGCRVGGRRLAGHTGRGMLSGSVYGVTGTVRVGVDIRTKEHNFLTCAAFCPFVLLSYPIIRFVILSECQIRTRENRVYGGQGKPPKILSDSREFCLIQKERKNVVVPVIWVGPAVCPAAWCAVWRKPDGTFQVQDVAVSLSAGQGQIILPCAEKAGKKAVKRPSALIFGCAFSCLRRMKNRFQSNDFPFSAERFHAFHKESEKTPLVASPTRAFYRTTPKRKPFFVLPFRGCSHDFYSQK